LSKAEIFYPSSDGEPLAETYDHLNAIIAILEVLRAYLSGQRATVLADQFLYYAQGYPRLRIAPDVMVIFNVEPGGRDNYKIWEEGEVPQVVFEVTSPSTRIQDESHKKNLYEQMGVTEYWQFDPRGEWIPEQLQGYRLHTGENPIYIPITDGCSQPLNLKLEVENKLIVFYRLDNGERLPLPQELAMAIAQEKQRADELADRLALYEQRFGPLEF
jgi:Uma2 family endonuclease